jgi:hypothetical protein
LVFEVELVSIQAKNESKLESGAATDKTPATDKPATSDKAPATDKPQDNKPQ